MPEPRMVDDVAQAAAAGGTFGAAFFAIRWLWEKITGRLDLRQAKLDEQDERIDRAWQRIREGLEERLTKLERQNEALRFAFHHVAAALIKVDPLNPALAQAEKVLAQAFPIDFQMLAARAEAALDRQAKEG